MRDLGYTSEVVEKWIPGANVKRDLFGFIDVIGVHDETGDVLAVQTTSYTNLSARVRKITDHENLPLVRKAGWSIHVHGWRKVGNRWQVKIKDLS
ncbi:MAG TPA: hypothetical protein VIN36_10430 [Thiobacillus sp.]